MAEDIVTRLRNLCITGDNMWEVDVCGAMSEAADEIEELRKAIYEISDSARKHYKSGILWGSINHAVDVADEHYKNCQCGERR